MLVINGKIHTALLNEVYTSNRTNPRLAPIPSTSNPPDHHLLQHNSLQLRQHLLPDVTVTSIRLNAENVVAPPRPSSPPKRTSPDIRVLGDKVQPALESRDTVRIVTTREFADETLLLVRSQPGGGSLQSVDKDSAVDASSASPRSIAVKILVHLVDQLVARVSEGAHCLGVGQAGRGVLCGRPGPGAGVGVAFGCDVLRCGASGADAVDGGLVELDDEVLVHVVELVVRVEDDAGVGGEGLGEVGPEGLEGGGVGDDGVVVAAVYEARVSVGGVEGGEGTDSCGGR